MIYQLKLKLWRFLLGVLVWITAKANGRVRIRLGDFYYGGECQRNPFFIVESNGLEFAFGVVTKHQKEKAKIFHVRDVWEKAEFLRTIEIMLKQNMAPSVEVLRSERTRLVA